MISLTLWLNSSDKTKSISAKGCLIDRKYSGLINLSVHYNSQAVARGHMSPTTRFLSFAYAERKAMSDAQYKAANQHLCFFRYLDSTIPLLPNS